MSVLRRWAVLFSIASAASAQSVAISGKVTDAAGAPLAGAAVRLERAGLSATSGSDGKFTLGNVTGMTSPSALPIRAQWRSGLISLELPARGRVSVTAYGVDGSALARVEKDLEAGSHGLNPPGGGEGVRFYVVGAGGSSILVRGLSLGGKPASESLPVRGAAAKTAAGELYDVITVTKTGYLKGYLAVSRAETSGVDIRLSGADSPSFSFFVASMRGLAALAKRDKGFGGDLRFGETGPGAGLRGADKICATLAEKSMPGAYFKGWRAFLSATADDQGRQVDAIDRIGAGPWYDRLGRLVANGKAGLLSTRPAGSPEISNDLPNEFGVPNHRPDPTLPEVDNHLTMTGSNNQGKLYGPNATCGDWTSTQARPGPRVGMSWPQAGGQPLKNWISEWDQSGCEAGFDLDPSTGAGLGSDFSVGKGGGYGGYYCFALVP